MSLTRVAGKRGYARCSELTRLWIVSAFPGTNIHKNAKGIRALLAQLEQAKANRLRAPGNSDVPGRVVTVHRHGI